MKWRGTFLQVEELYRFHEVEEVVCALLEGGCAGICIKHCMSNCGHNHDLVTLVLVLHTHTRQPQIQFHYCSTVCFAPIAIAE